MSKAVYLHEGQKSSILYGHTCWASPEHDISIVASSTSQMDLKYNFTVVLEFAEVCGQTSGYPNNGMDI